MLTRPLIVLLLATCAVTAQAAEPRPRSAKQLAIKAIKLTKQGKAEHAVELFARSREAGTEVTPLVQYYHAAACYSASLYRCAAVHAQAAARNDTGESERLGTLARQLAKSAQLRRKRQAKSGAAEFYRKKSVLALRRGLVRLADAYLDEVAPVQASTGRSKTLELSPSDTGTTTGTSKLALAQETTDDSVERARPRSEAMKVVALPTTTETIGRPSTPIATASENPSSESAEDSEEGEGDETLSLHLAFEGGFDQNRALYRSALPVFGEDASGGSVGLYSVLTLRPLGREGPYAEVQAQGRALFASDTPAAAGGGVGWDFVGDGPRLSASWNYLMTGVDGHEHLATHMVSATTGLALGPWVVDASYELLLETYLQPEHEFRTGANHTVELRAGWEPEGMFMSHLAYRHGRHFSEALGVLGLSDGIVADVGLQLWSNGSVVLSGTAARRLLSQDPELELGHNDFELRGELAFTLDLTDRWAIRVSGLFGRTWSDLPELTRTETGLALSLVFDGPLLR